jgi:hypothetical protein
MTMPLPNLIEITQTYPSSPQLNFRALLAEQFQRQGLGSQISPGMRIAVGVGSRGIANLKEIVQAAVSLLTTAGARPFVIPAMGSHGGATPAGQTKVLAEYGVTPETIGAPIEASMDVEPIGKAFDGLDVLFSTAALRADAIVVMNRIKPHTDFRGTLGSGIQKMLAIGFGKQAGAANAHRAAAHRGHEAVIREFAGVILSKAPVLCGIALLEDQNHQTAELKVIPAKNIASEEAALFKKAASWMPRLPLDEIDLLIVDQIGKEISGTGMDTNIIGRDITGYSTSLDHNGSLKPHISRIFVRDLSPLTYGNGIGIGLADFTTSRAVKALDLHAMYLNAVTSIGLHPAKVPMYFDSDREAIHHAVSTLACSHSEKARIVRISNTLNLSRMLVSDCCSEILAGQPQVKIAGGPRPIQFDDGGNLLSF